MKVLIECVLALVCVFFGSMWWALIKRDRFMRQAAQDDSLISRFVTGDLFKNPPARIAIYAQGDNYLSNLSAVVAADKRALRSQKIIFGLLSAAALLASFFLGFIYFAINLGLFFLVGLQPVPESAKINALEQIAAVALILYRWNANDAPECNAFVSQAHSLSRLYAGVLRAAGL